MTWWIAGGGLDSQTSHLFIMEDKVQCRECYWIGLRKNLLFGVNPFNVEETIHGCPECKQCTDGFDGLCYIEGCEELAGCGFPTKAHGYLFTCHKHYEEYKHS
jgi:hypothetical protein